MSDNVRAAGWSVLLVLGGLAAWISMPSQAADAPLFGFSITQRSADGTVTSVLQFREVERSPSTSIIEMVYTPVRNGVDLSQLTYGACLLMKARSEQFVDVRQVPQNPTRFEVTFPRGVVEQPLGAGAHLSAAQCQRFVSMFTHAG